MVSAGKGQIIVLCPGMIGMPKVTGVRLRVRVSRSREASFVPRGFQADLKSLDLAEPAVDAGLLDAVTEIADDLFQTSALLRIDAEHRTPHAGFSELPAAARQRLRKTSGVSVDAPHSLRLRDW
jgi:hypothetical protein